MRIKKKNVARLASISALGAGALGVAAGTAEASIVYTPLDLTVGFSPGSVASVVLNLPPYTWRYIGPTSTVTNKLTEKIVVRATDIGHGIQGKLVGASWEWFQVSGNIVKTFGPGAEWPAGGSTSPAALIAGRLSASSIPYQMIGNFSHEYALFKFQAASQWDYGWLELSGSVSATSGPDVTVEGYAYDTSGNPIAAGDTGAAPEPSTLALAALAALALGATGLRRWRCARKPAA